MNPIKQLFDSSGSHSKPLLLDGAMGSLLNSRGIEANSNLWMSHANLLYPLHVRQIHSEYISAGADIITTNTFRTNPAALRNSEFNSEQLVFKAVNLAKEARNDFTDILIAGSNAPAEDCYQVERTLSIDDLRNNHHQHIDLLMNSGCDFILNETHSHIDEIKIICQYCSGNNIPYIISLFFTDELKLLSGEDILIVIELLECFNPIAIGFNCVHPSVFGRSIARHKPNLPWGFYLNLGGGNYTDDKIVCSFDASEYLNIIKEFIKYKPAFIGACCGSDPSHIKKIREYIDELYRN